jgi:ribonuclease HI
MIKITFDGSVIFANKGGWGFTYENCNEYRKFYGQIKYDDLTCNVSEHYAVFEALKFLKKEKLNFEKIKFYGDSKMICEQLNEKWKIGKGIYVPIAKKNVEILKDFTDFEFIWIPREQNFIADELSRKYAKVIDVNNFFNKDRMLFNL